MREYLIVYPAEELVERFVFSEGGYGAGDVFGAEDILPLAVFPELRLNLWELFGKPVPTVEATPTAKKFFRSV